MSDTIYVTRSGTYYKGKQYAAGETIPTNRWGGPSVVSGGNSTPIQSIPSQISTQESITENKPEFVDQNSPSINPVIDSSKSKEETIKLNKAFIQEKKFNQPLNPSETLAPVPRVEQSAMTFGVDTRGRIESNVPESKEEKRNQEFSRARQEFKDNLLTQSNYQPPDAFKNVQTAGKVVVLGGVSFGAGVVKGSTGAVKDVVTGQIITKTGEGLTELASNPKGVLVEFKQGLQRNGPGFVGEQVGYAVTLNKVPSVSKKIVSGSKSYLNRYEVAGYKYDPITVTPSTGKPFYAGDLDIKPNVQTTLTGERVNPALLPKKSPLGLEHTSLYVGEGEARLLESGRVVKGSGSILDDNIRVPEVRLENNGFVQVANKEFTVQVPVKSETVFKERFIGERTDTSLLPKSEKVQSFTPEFNPTSKPLYDIKSAKKNVVDVDYVEVKQVEVLKDSSVQKKLNFKRKIDGSDKFIGANVGLFSESQKLFGNIGAEFKIKQRGVASELGEIVDKGVKPKRLPLVDLNKKSVSSNNSVFVNNVSSPKSVQDVKPVSESVVLQDVKPVEDVSIKPNTRIIGSTKVKSVVLQKSNQDQAIGFKLSKRQESVQVYSPIVKSVSRNKNVLRFKGSKGKSVRVPVLRNVKSKNKVSGSFLAQVKRRGKFVSVGVFDSSESAFGRARNVVSNSASASLRVKKVGGGVVSPRGFLGNQFTLSKKNSGVLVERRGQRIKSAGEKSEITMKGIMFNKNKKLFRGRI